MNSASSTEPGGTGRDTGLQIWQVFLILSMCAAIWVVVVSRHTHPAALLLVSAAVIAAGFVGVALHHAFAGFFGAGADIEDEAVSERTRAMLEQEKALVLRSIKELEFDRAMGKVSEADFADMQARLRERALALMQDLERGRASRRTGQQARRPEPRAPESRATQPAEPRAADLSSEVRAAEAAPGARVSAERAPAAFCPSCGSRADAGARFCKDCGARL